VKRKKFVAQRILAAFVVIAIVCTGLLCLFQVNVVSASLHWRDSFAYNGIPFEWGLWLRARHSEGVFVPVNRIDLPGRIADKIHIIEWSDWATNVPDGVVVGHINVFYEGGNSTTLDLILGGNTAEWAYDMPEGQCCQAYTKLPPAYSWWTNQDSDYFYWGHNFYVSIDTEHESLDYLELILDPAYTSQPSCPESCLPDYPLDWLGVGINAITLEISEPDKEFVTIWPEGDGCFIATAAYGTSTAEEIDVLRAFRDEVLLESTLGSQLVEWYYQTSPPVADFISGHDVLRTLVKELLVDPVVWVVDAVWAVDAIWVVDVNWVVDAMETLWRD